MITQKDILKVNLTKQEVNLAFDFSRQAMIGGVSRIRDSQDRKDNLSIDQFVGVGLGELAGNKLYFSIDEYKKSREFKNLNPYKGDSGCDTLGFKVDYKGSHAKKDDLLSYNLLVRPRERHKDFTYVLILVKTFGKPIEKLLIDDSLPEVYVIGWATEDMLPKEPVSSGIFSGAYLLPTNKLNPPNTLSKDIISKL